MKLLLDQGLPRSAAELLSQAGHDAIHVGDIGMHASADSAIVQKAREDGRVIVTLDADFHALLALSNLTAPSVIRIRREGLRGQDVADIVGRIILEFAEDLRSGVLISVGEKRVKARRLPLP